MNRRQIALTRIKSVDRDGVLAPFMESNAEEFFAPGNKPRVTVEVIMNWARRADLDESSRQAVKNIAEEVLSDPTLAFLFFHCSRLAYEFAYLYPGDKIIQWPSLEAFLPERESLFLLLIALSAIPSIHRQHEMLDIEAEITRDTCGDIASRIEISREFFNRRIGVSRKCINWLRNHAKGQLFQFDRLQFHPIIFGEPIRIYRRKDDGRVLLLAEPGKRFTADGFYDGAGGVLHDDAWYSDWQMRDSILTANRFNALGCAERKAVKIDLTEWHVVVDSSSAVMNTHIPRGRKINVEEWNQSIRRGFDFFRSHRLVSAPVAACVCRSWMFDPKLQFLLPETAGLVTLQKSVKNLFPCCSAETKCGFSFIFGRKATDSGEAPRDTSLRRAVLDYVERGGTLSGGGMVIFEDQVQVR